MRTSGILFPVFSLPGKYGIGCFSEEAYRFVDFLKEAGQTYWQILPLGPTGYGDSPYQSFSTFAGNPYLISLEELISQGLLSREECEAVDFGDDDSAVDYGKLYMGRWDLLRKAYTRSEHKNTEEFLAFQKENDFWLGDYALFLGGCLLKHLQLLRPGLFYELLLLPGKTTHFLFGHFRIPEGFTDSLGPFFDHIGHGGETGLCQDEEQQAEDQDHPKDESYVRSHKGHGRLPDEQAEDTGDDCKQGGTLDHTGDDDHAGTEVAGGLGLTGDGFHDGLADLSDSICSGESCYGSSHDCTELTERDSGNCLKDCEK